MTVKQISMLMSQGEGDWWWLDQGLYTFNLFIGGSA